LSAFPDATSASASEDPMTLLDFTTELYCDVFAAKGLNCYTNNAVIITFI